jgi:hypothetical protein
MHKLKARRSHGNEDNLIAVLEIVGMIQNTKPEKIRTWGK